METPAGHERNADQIAFWNGPGGQHWTDRQPMQDVLLAPVSQILIDRAGPKPGERILDVGCGCGATTIAFAEAGCAVGLRVRHRHLGADAGAGAAARAGGLADRFRACRCDRLSVRPCKLRSSGFAVRRDVLRRTRGFLCQSASGTEAVGAAGIRLLAGAARESLYDDAAAGRLQTCSEAAAVGTRRSRPVRICLRGARAAHSGRGRLHADSDGALQSRARPCDRTGA